MASLGAETAKPVEGGGSKWRYEQRYNDSTHLWERFPSSAPQHVVFLDSPVVDSRVVQRLQGMKNFRVLRLAGLSPATTYCAKSLDPDATALELLVARLIRDNSWCCAAFDKAAPGTYSKVLVPWPGVTPNSCPPGQNPL